MNFLPPAGALALAALLANGALAQDSQVQRFPLNKAIPESGITACLTQEVPIKVNTLLADGQDDEAAQAFREALMLGQCINGAGVVTYSRQVHRVEGPDGLPLTVYEGSAGRTKFFVPMHGYLHEDSTV